MLQTLTLANVSVSKVSVKLLSSTGSGEEATAVCALEATSTLMNPLYKCRLELRHDTFDPRAMLLIRVDTLSAKGFPLAYVGDVVVSVNPFKTVKNLKNLERLDLQVEVCNETIQLVNQNLNKECNLKELQILFVDKTTKELMLLPGYPEMGGATWPR